MHSESQYPQQIQDNFDQDAELSDNSLVIEYQHNDRNWDWRFGHYDWGKDFRADLGFINRVDYIYQVATIGHTWWWSGDSFFNRIRFAADYDRTEDQSGLLLEEETEFFLNMNGPLQSSYLVCLAVAKPTGTGSTSKNNSTTSTSVFPRRPISSSA